MTIKSVIKKEETIEREISLPYFCKYFDKFSDKFTYFKLTEDKVIDAMIGIYTSVSCYSHGVNDRKIAESEQITEQEFNEAYHKALFEIGKYVPAPDVPKQYNDFDEYLNSYYKESPNYKGYYIANNCDYPLLTIQQIHEEFARQYKPIETK